MANTISANDACIATHAALRRACGTPESNNLYHVISVVCDLRILPAWDPWRAYGRLVSEAMAAGAISAKALAHTAMRVPDVFAQLATEARKKGRNPSFKALSALAALDSAFKLLRPEDWQNIANCLNE